MLADEDLPELNPRSSESTAPGHDEPKPSASNPAAPPRGVVVVRERPRSRLIGLLPPILILLASLGILTFRVHSPDWRGWALPDAPAAPTQVEGSTQAAELQNAEATSDPAESGPEANAIADNESVDPPPAVTEPLVEETPPFPEPVPQRTAKVVDEPEVESPRPSMPDGQPITLTAELYRPLIPEVKAAEARPDPRRVQAELQREAQANADERQRLADLKPVLQRQDEIRAKEEKAEREARQFQDDQERRKLFLDELRQALQGKRADAVSEIRRLARLPADEPIPMSPSSIQRARNLALSRNQRQAWVVEARSQGIDESAILGDLALAHLVNVVARTGPRTDDEALILASRELISVPTDLTASVTAPTPPAPPAIHAPTSRQGTSRFGTSNRRR